MNSLGTIADIRMGVTLRGRDATRPDPNGSFKFLRIGDISQDGTLRSQDFLRIEPNEQIREDLWLRPGDVLFPNRGARTTALVFPLDEPRIIVGHQFYIIRPHGNRTSPEYLAWYLRSDEAALHFNSRRAGTLVLNIQRNALASLMIPLPPVDVQQRVVAIADLARREREISERLIELKDRYTNELLARAVHNAAKHLRDSY